MAYMMATHVYVKITCDYETKNKHEFLTDLMSHRGLLVCPTCGRRYKAFGGYTVELVEDEETIKAEVREEEAPAVDDASHPGVCNIPGCKWCGGPPAVEVGHGEMPPELLQSSFYAGQSRYTFEAYAAFGHTTPDGLVMTSLACKGCKSELKPGQTFYFFGVEGPLCVACYANDPRKKAW